MRAGVDVASGRPFRVERHVEAVHNATLPGIDVRVETTGPVGTHGGPAFTETGGDLVVVPVRRLRGRGPLVEVTQQPERPSARLIIQAGRGRTFILEHPASCHRVQLEEVAEEPRLLAGESKTVEVVGSQP